jgi:hypothetical protein
VPAGAGRVRADGRKELRAAAVLVSKVCGAERRCLPAHKSSLSTLRCVMSRNSAVLVRSGSVRASTRRTGGEFRATLWLGRGLRRAGGGLRGRCGGRRRAVSMASSSIYADPRIMPALTQSVLVSGRDRAGDVGIIPVLRGRQELA